MHQIPICFSRDDLAEIFGSVAAADWKIRKLQEEGSITRIRRNLYTLVDKASEEPQANRFAIASKAGDHSYVSYHSAFEYHGCANQVFFVTYYSSSSRSRPFEFEGMQYQQVKSAGNVGIDELDDGVRVTSYERTVIDGIADFGLAGGLEEFLRCLFLVPSLSADKLLEVLEMYNIAKLYQKAGYILEEMNGEFSLPQYFFAECEKHSGNSKTYLVPNHNGFVLNKRWKLYAPPRLASITSKGVDCSAL